MCTTLANISKMEGDVQRLQACPQDTHLGYRAKLDPLCIESRVQAHGQPTMLHAEQRTSARKGALIEARRDVREGC